MKLINYGIICLLIGLFTINVPSLAFGQGVTIEISGSRALISIPEINSGTIVAIDVTDRLDFPIRSLEISAKRLIDIAEFDIQIVNSNPRGVEEVNGTVYQYLTIDTNLGSEDVSYIKIYFGVSQSWFSASDIDKTIVRLISTSAEGDWDIILTEVSEETADEIIFYAPLINLDAQNYAIAEIPPWVATTTLTQIATKTTTITTDIATITSTSTPMVTATVTSVVEGGSTLIYLAIGGAVAAIAILLVVSRSRKRK